MSSWDNNQFCVTAKLSKFFTETNLAAGEKVSK